MARESSTGNKELIVGNTTAEYESSIHPHNVLSLIFLAQEVMWSPKPYKSFKSCRTLTFSLFRGAEKPYWKGLKQEEKAGKGTLISCPRSAGSKGKAFLFCNWCDGEITLLL